ncbi:hypothetical protein MAPG_08382 [Magnaporthiopsis poae ATCC 64411]|uniref:Peptidase S8/S53 domain-containing protein n=1 Tax=Magnaporthiopsis poae (strain ATCC 64411 / 73-15) TaxID=644358 RepID=A0A0C4E779_MAGP6|nr:hypothetical protein MAPG_08382 [Magnaporthiopsis poae ATCC 64411]
MYAHYAIPSPENELECHQYEYASTQIGFSYKEYKEGREGLRNAQDHARKQPTPDLAPGSSSPSSPGLCPFKKDQIWSKAGLRRGGGFDPCSRPMAGEREEATERPSGKDSEKLGVYGVPQTLQDLRLPRGDGGKRSREWNLAVMPQLPAGSEHPDHPPDESCAEWTPGLDATVISRLLGVPKPRPNATVASRLLGEWKPGLDADTAPNPARTSRLGLMRQLLPACSTHGLTRPARVKRQFMETDYGGFCSELENETFDTARTTGSIVGFEQRTLRHAWEWQNLHTQARLSSYGEIAARFGRFWSPLLWDTIQERSDRGFLGIQDYETQNYETAETHHHGGNWPPRSCWTACIMTTAVSVVVSANPRGPIHFLSTTVHQQPSKTPKHLHSRWTINRRGKVATAFLDSGIELSRAQEGGNRHFGQWPRAVQKAPDSAHKKVAIAILDSGLELPREDAPIHIRGREIYYGARSKGRRGIETHEETMNAASMIHRVYEDERSVYLSQTQGGEKPQSWTAASSCPGSGHQFGSSDEQSIYRRGRKKGGSRNSGQRRRVIPGADSISFPAPRIIRDDGVQQRELGADSPH